MKADTGLLGPGSVSWRVNREQAMILGGGCALLLQLAHPLVAAGVADHSDFSIDPLSRLRRTLDAGLALVFGSVPQAEDAAARIRSVHERVRGTLAEPAGRFHAGTPYRGDDPALLLWVQATLFDTSIRTYETFIGALPREDRRRYYDESLVIGRLLGIPDDVRPPTYADFVRYWNGMLASGEIAVGEPARRLARRVLYPRIRPLPRPVFAPTALLTLGLLPPSVRERFGYRWGTAQGTAYRASSTAIRSALRLVPARLRTFPKAREAERRVAAVG